METIKKYKYQKYGKMGLTLIELIIVLFVLGIILAIAIPSYVSVIRYSKEQSCSISRLQLERMYEIKLQVENVGHSDEVFEKFLNNYDGVCPLGGTYTYFNNEIECQFHDRDSSEDDKEEVPFL